MVYDAPLVAPCSRLFRLKGGKDVGHATRENGKVRVEVGRVSSPVVESVQSVARRSFRIVE